MCSFLALKLLTGSFFFAHLRGSFAALAVAARWCKWAERVLQAKFAVDQQLRQEERVGNRADHVFEDFCKAVVGAGVAFASADLVS